MLTISQWLILVPWSGPSKFPGVNRGITAKFKTNIAPLPFVNDDQRTKYAWMCCSEYWIGLSCISPAHGTWHCCHSSCSDNQKYLWPEPNCCSWRLSADTDIRDHQAVGHSTASRIIDISSAKSGWSGLVSFAPSMCQVCYHTPRCFQMMFL